MVELSSRLVREACLKKLSDDNSIMASSDLGTISVKRAKPNFRRIEIMPCIGRMNISRNSLDRRERSSKSFGRLKEKKTVRQEEVSILLSNPFHKNCATPLL